MYHGRIREWASAAAPDHVRTQCAITVWVTGYSRYFMQIGTRTLQFVLTDCFPAKIQLEFIYASRAHNNEGGLMWYR